MTGWRLFHDLRRRGVRLRAQNGRVQAAGNITRADRQAIAENRGEILRLLDAEDLAHRYVAALKAGADLPVLATVDREDLRRFLDAGEAAHGAWVRNKEAFSRE